MPELFVWLQEFEADLWTTVFPDLHVNYGAFDFLFGRNIAERYDLTVDDRFF